MTMKINCQNTDPHVDHYYKDCWCSGVDNKEVAVAKLRDHVLGLLNEYLKEINDNGLEAETYSHTIDEIAEDFGMWIEHRE